MSLFHRMLNPDWYVYDPSTGAEPEAQPLGWRPPVAVGDERLQCAYCPWSCPLRYQNQTGAKIEGGRDGNTRLLAHVKDEHREEHRCAKARAKSKAAYDRRKAERAGTTHYA